MSLKNDDTVPAPFTIEKWCAIPQRLRTNIRHAAADTLQENQTIISEYLAGNEMKPQVRAMLERILN